MNWGPKQPSHQKWKGPPLSQPWTCSWTCRFCWLFSVWNGGDHIICWYKLHSTCLNHLQVVKHTKRSTSIPKQASIFLCFYTIHCPSLLLHLPKLNPKPLVLHPNVQHPLIILNGPESRKITLTEPAAPFVCWQRQVSLLYILLRCYKNIPSKRSFACLVGASNSTAKTKHLHVYEYIWRGYFFFAHRIKTQTFYFRTPLPPIPSERPPAFNWLLAGW